MKKKLPILILGFLLSLGAIQAQNWAQIGEDIDGKATYDSSGTSVSISSNGSVVAIGSPLNDGSGNNTGHVRIFNNQDGTWIQVGQSIGGEDLYDWSGSSVSLNSDGSVVAIGAPYNNGNGSDAGQVRIYENQDGTWIQVGEDIDGEAAGDHSGHSVSLSSDGLLVAIGAIYNIGNGASGTGQVRIYENQDGTWIQIGQDIDGEAEGDNFGMSVSMNFNGSIVAIGAPYNDGNGSDAGHVRIYENQDGTWIQVGEDIDGEASADYSGWSSCLSSNGSVVAIGGFYNNGNGNNSGHVRIYENQNGNWIQIGQDIDGEATFDASGYSVSLSSDGLVVAIGAIKNDGNGNESGHVRIYENQNGTWIQTVTDIDGETTLDESGYSVSLNSDGSVVAIGSPYNNGSGTGAGHVRVYGLPGAQIVTNDVTNITTTSAIGNGTITVVGSPNLIQHGVCWNTTGNPTIANNYTEEGAPIAGDFTSEITGLSSSQTYFVKAYITTDVEIIYGNEISFTTLITRISDLSKTGISIFPNPTNGIFTIDYPNLEQSHIRITDITGKIILSLNNVDEKQIDISNFENGIYLIIIQTTKKVFSTKIIKQ